MLNFAAKATWADRIAGPVPFQPGPCERHFFRPIRCLPENIRTFSTAFTGTITLKLRLGIIGTGTGWASRHAPALRMLHDRFDVRAVFSPTVRLAENIAADFQSDVVDGFQCLVRRCDIDAVLVLEKTWLGWLPLIAAARAGKAIYFAGDCDLDPVRDQVLLEEIDQSGVSMMVEFPFRYSPATLRLKELIATRLGPVQLVFCHHRTTQQSDLADHRIQVRSEILQRIDWCNYIVGSQPSDVSSSAHLREDGGRDYRCLTLRYPRQAGQGDASSAPGNSGVKSSNGTSSPAGPHVEISFGTFFPPHWSDAMAYQTPSALQVCCANGMAFVDPPASLVWFDEAGRHRESLESETPVGQRLLCQFHRSVTSLLRNVGDLDDAYAAARVLASADASEVKGIRKPIEYR